MRNLLETCGCGQPIVSSWNVNGVRMVYPCFWLVLVPHSPKAYEGGVSENTDFPTREQVLSLRIGADKSQSKEGEGIGDTFLGDGMLPWDDRFTWRGSVAPVGDTAAPVGDAVAPVGATGQPAELARPSHESASHLLCRQKLPMWTCRTKPVALEKLWLHGVFQLPLWMGGSCVGKIVESVAEDI